jgi:hypothetical protein
MAKSFDATLNALIDARLGDRAAYLAARCGLPPGPASPLDTDLSATLQADRLFRVGGPAPYALHLELEVSSRLGVPDRMLRYSVAARSANHLPVHSVLVLLRPEARASDQTGVFEAVGVDGRPYHTFRYAVVRVWEESAANLLAAGLGLAPLALATNEAVTDPAGVFARFEDRLRGPDPPGNLEPELVNWAYVLAGLRHDPDTIRRLFMSMDDLLEASSVGPAIKEIMETHGVGLGDAVRIKLIRDRDHWAGVLDHARDTVLRLGAKRFGPPPAGAEAAIRAEADRGRLDRLADRVLDAAGWDDLLATP